MVQLLTQWKDFGHRKETVQDTHQLEAPFCRRDDVAIAVVCDAIPKKLCRQDTEV
jgi:hypothetical protein